MWYDPIVAKRGDGKPPPLCHARVACVLGLKSPADPQRVYRARDYPPVGGDWEASLITYAGGRGLRE